jgi:hypothetical protein
LGSRILAAGDRGVYDWLDEGLREVSYLEVFRRPAVSQEQGCSGLQAVGE